jgi:hypothetical protein
MSLIGPKISILRLPLATFAMLAGLLAGFQTISRADTEESSLSRGRWNEARPPASSELDTAIEQLEAIGYLPGTVEAQATTGVTRHDTGRSLPGLNFYNSGHRTGATLMDMEGRVLHEWYYPYEKVWPGQPSQGRTPGRESWRRAYLWPNGDVLAIFEGQGIIKIDRDSNLLWSNSMLAHHEAHIQPNGDIYVLDRKASLLEHIHPFNPTLEDFVTVLGPDGQTKRRVSLLRCMENSPFLDILKRRKRDGDIFHTNSLFVLDGSEAPCIPEFRAGRVLVSILVLNAAVLVDLDEERAVWALDGTFRRQHDARMLDNGNMLLFDNRGRRSASRILEYDPAIKKVVWQYAAPRGDPFFSRTCGAARRLTNGNTLIVESDNGRAFEVTSGRKTVWEFRSPHRVGFNNRYVATLFDLQRFPREFFESWLEIPQ